MNAPISAAGAAALSLAESTRMTSAIRMLAADAVEHAKSGHPGAPMGMAEMAWCCGTGT